MSSIITENPGAHPNDHALGTDHQRLFYLHDLEDYKVHHDDPDVRGWTVKLDTGETVGTVDNLIVDRAAEQVRYLEVRGDANFYGTYRDRSSYLDNDFHEGYKAGTDELVIVPVGMVQLDRSNKSCSLSGVTADYIGLAPRYRRGSALRPRYEIETLHYYDNNHPDYVADNKAYSPFDRTAYRDFDENRFQGMHDRFYGHRMFNTDRYYDRHDKASTPAAL